LPRDGNDCRTFVDANAHGGFGQLKQDTFWMLVVLLEKYIPMYHSQTLYGLRVDAACFELLLKKKLSRQFYSRIQELSPLTYMTQWFLTIYSMALPWNTVLRVWDMFLHDGNCCVLI
jgi:hypothetical protein